jgi:transcription-repair coupling factor (superfamily II helicase)
LLGDEQSGQIQSVGFGLYMQMLQRAVAALKRGEIPDIDAPLDHGSEIKLHMPALIPEDYLPDINSRLILYKRIAAASDDAQLRDLQVEMIDRFGLLPPQVKNLFEVSRLRLKAQSLGIRAIEAGPEGGSIDFNTNTRVHPLSLVKLVQSEPRAYKLTGATRLRFQRPLPDTRERQHYVEQLLDSFATDATDHAA